MERTLIVARHGNTFKKGDLVTRVGAKTDLPLVEEERGRNIGRYLRLEKIIPTRVLVAPLKRTRETALLALKELGSDIPLEEADIFTEVDYGPDENKSEEEVLKRLGASALKKENLDKDFSKTEILKAGKEVLKAWDQRAIVPDGWHVNVNAIISSWLSFAKSIKDGEKVLVVSSNGIIRFMPHILTLDYRSFCNTHTIKVATGNLCIFKFNDMNKEWEKFHWNLNPKDYLDIS